MGQDFTALGTENARGEDAGRSPEPTYAIIDSQSVKTVSASEERGIDGGKKRKAESGILS